MEYEESETSTEPSEPSEDSEESDEGKRFFVDSTKNKVDSGTGMRFTLDKNSFLYYI